MYLFIFESIGTSELILIGIVALIFLGPRRMPEMAKKLGKIMAEFRTTTQDFRETWEREVNFEEETKAFDLDTIERETSKPAAESEASSEENSIGAPSIKELDATEFDRLSAEASMNDERPEFATNEDEPADVVADQKDLASDKRSWL